MADKASRSWDPTDSQLVDFFNHVHPQTAPWRSCHLTSAANSAVTSALLTKRCATQLITTTPSAKMPTGSPGSNFAPVSGFIPFLPMQKIPSPSSKSSPSGAETVDWPPAVNPSQLSAFQTSSPRWARRSPFWGPRKVSPPVPLPVKVLQSQHTTCLLLSQQKLQANHHTPLTCVVLQAKLLLIGHPACHQTKLPRDQLLFY